MPFAAACPRPYDLSFEVEPFNPFEESKRSSNGVRVSN